MSRRRDSFGSGPGTGLWSPMREMEHLTHVDAARDELAACGLDVGHDEKHSLSRARHGRRALPKWMEHGEPGGVSCTARQSCRP